MLEYGGMRHDLLPVLDPPARAFERELTIRRKLIDEAAAVFVIEHGRGVDNHAAVHLAFGRSLIVVGLANLEFAGFAQTAVRRWTKKMISNVVSQPVPLIQACCRTTRLVIVLRRVVGVFRLLLPFSRSRRLRGLAGDGSSSRLRGSLRRSCAYLCRRRRRKFRLLRIVDNVLLRHLRTNHRR
jgi:hypothetical protein